MYQAAPTPEQEAGWHLAAALRLVIDRLVATGATAGDLASAAHDFEQLAARLDGFAHGSMYRHLAQGAGGAEGARAETAASHPAAFFDFGPFLGRANPLAPPLTVEIDGDAVIGRARFGHAYEGPPGCVHGGVIAACFDDVLGLVQTASGQVAMTGRLAVRYAAPTPLGVEVRFIGIFIGIDGRKVMTHGELFAGDVRTAEADGLFITVPAEHFDKLRAGPVPGGSGPDTSGASAPPEVNPFAT